MKKTFVIILSIAAVALLVGCGTPVTAKSQSIPTIGPTSATGKSSGAITAEGSVIPVEDTVLSFATPGVISEVLVKKGQVVKAGQVLARLDGVQSCQASLSASELDFLTAQLALEQMTSPVEIAKVQKIVAQDKQDIEDAQKAYDNEKFFTTNHSAIQNSHSSLVLAQEALEDAQNDYDRVEGDPNINTAKANAYQILYKAQQVYDNALYLYNRWSGKENANALELKAANLAIAKAKLVEDQTLLDVLTGGSIPSNATGAGIVQLQQARLNVQVTHDKVEAAKTAMANLELKTPLDGTIITLNLKVGMYFQPGMEAAKLADTSSWLIKTTDLTELDIARIQPGMNAAVKLDALPGIQIAAQVQSIENLGQNHQGDIVYAVELKLNQPDPRLRWNMTANVTFVNPK